MKSLTLRTPGYPSHAAIAGRAGVGLRTVARHLARMAELGLLTQI